MSICVGLPQNLLCAKSEAAILLIEYRLGVDAPKPPRLAAFIIGIGIDALATLALLIPNPTPESQAWTIKFIIELNDIRFFKKINSNFNFNKISKFIIF